MNKKLIKINIVKFLSCKCHLIATSLVEYTVLLCVNDRFWFSLQLYIIMILIMNGTFVSLGVR